MKKIIISLVLMVCVMLSGCGADKSKAEISEVDQMVEKIENAMYEVLGDDLKKMSTHELVATLEYGNRDGEGYGINYRIIKSTYYEADPDEVTGLNKEALNVLFDTESADSCEEMMINDWHGALYRVGDLSYLCFTYSPEVTYALEYKSDEVTDADILKMAQSAVPLD